MAVYFFDLSACDLSSPDEEGMTCATLETAERIALHSARSIMSSEILLGRLCLDCVINIRDEAGAIVLRVPFSSAVTLDGHAPTEAIALQRAM